MYTFNHIKCSLAHLCKLPGSLSQTKRIVVSTSVSIKDNTKMKKIATLFNEINTTVNHSVRYLDIFIPNV